VNESALVSAKAKKFSKPFITSKAQMHQLQGIFPTLYGFVTFYILEMLQKGGQGDKTNQGWETPGKLSVCAESASV